ncbi:MAG: prepilin-type N-terminal cleavage/methylation domain-containing protein [Planctomycetota bacterium]
MKRGFTLLEVVLVLALLPALLMAVYSWSSSLRQRMGGSQERLALAQQRSAALMVLRADCRQALARSIERIDDHHVVIDTMHRAPGDPPAPHRVEHLWREGRWWRLHGEGAHLLQETEAWWQARRGSHGGLTLRTADGVIALWLE